MKKIILGRDGMGDKATEEDFRRWVVFVCDHIDAAFGEEVDVDYQQRGTAGECTIIENADVYERNEMQNALQQLWRDWCAGRAPAKVTFAKLPGVLGAAHVDTPNGEEDEGPFLIDYPDSAERRR